MGKADFRQFFWFFKSLMLQGFYEVAFSDKNPTEQLPTKKSKKEELFENSTDISPIGCQQNLCNYTAVPLVTVKKPVQRGYRQLQASKLPKDLSLKSRGPADFIKKLNF